MHFEDLNIIYINQKIRNHTRLQSYHTTAQTSGVNQSLKREKYERYVRNHERRV